MRWILSQKNKFTKSVLSLLMITMIPSLVSAKPRYFRRTPTITLYATQVAAGQPIKFTVSGTGANAQEWVALYSSTRPDTASYDGNWMYLNGLQTQPASPISSATLTLTAPTVAGTYNIRLFAYNGNTKRLAVSQNITVPVSDTPSPTPTPTPNPSPSPTPSSSSPYATLPSTTNHLYVSTSGSDSNPGTKSAPLRTINRAAALAKPSTTVHVASGTYGENITSTTSGTSGGYIYYVSDVKWGAKIVPPAGSAGANAWRQQGNYVWIVGFHFDGSSVPAGWRIGIWNSGSYVTVRDTHMHHVAAGAPCNNNGGAGILMSGYTDGRFHDILNNVIHHNGPKGCWYFHGIYMSSFDFNVKNNISYANASVGIAGNHDVGRGYVGNNTVFQNGRRGISLQGEDFYFASAGGPFTVENNLVYDNNTDGPFSDGSATGITVFGTLTGTSVVRNNFSANNRNTEIYMKPGYGSAYGNITTGSPGFVNYKTDGTGDYRLLSNSPLIDKGYSSTNTPLFDLDYKARPQCSGFDIGAYEFPCP